ncbi:unnamed protein product [Echinostoma caproni]|uniref:DUF2384 domain-containing protein n=1 Tax=Echinostoma caproni TaxID=27848 RepID=A0A183B067_9TREM|nr:unnamed protein product [Echinostoma caproni]
MTTKISLDTAIGESHRWCTRVSLGLRSINGKDYVDVARAYTMPPILNVEAIGPTQETLSNWFHLNDVELSPLSSKTLSILIGLDTPEAHWVLEQRRGV